MAFRFSLETLLRYRRSVEHQRELRLQEANQRVAGLQRQIESMDTSLHDMAERHRVEMTSGMSAAELQFSLLCRAMLIEVRSGLAKHLAEAEEQRGFCRNNYLQSRRQAEVVDTLRNRQMERYEEQETRREQSRVDDLYLLRRFGLRRGS